MVSGGAAIGTQAPAQPPAPPPAAAPPTLVADPEDAALGITVDGDRRSVPQSAFSKLKERERKKGEAEANAAIQRMLKEAGYDSMDELIEKAKKANAEPPPPEDPEEPVATTPSNNPRGTGGNGERQRRTLSSRMREKLKKEQEKQRAALSTANRARASEKRRRRAAEAKVGQLQTENELKMLAVQLGVKDVDYAVDLIRREIRKKSDNELKEFKPEEFYAGLRESRPYLFGEVTVPANTGTGAGGSPPPTPPQPGNAIASTAQGEQVDARKMNPQEFKEYLRRNGLSTKASTPGLAPNRQVAPAQPGTPPAPPAGTPPAGTG